MGRHQREKGKRVERSAAAAWERITGNPARRSVQYCGAEGHGDLIATDGIHIEVKGRKHIAVLRFWEQAKDDARPGDIPIVLMKEDRGDFYVLLRVDDVPMFAERVRDEIS